MSPIPNPFAASVNTPVPEAPEPTWGIAASGPPIDPSEVESADSAVEVVILWGDEDVLHVEHVSPPRDVVIGEASGSHYLVGADVLGTERLPVVVERGGRLSCVVPDGATGSITVGAERKTFEALEAEGKLLPFDELPGARLYPLPDGASARVAHRGLSFLVRPTQAGKAVAAGGQVQWRRYGWVGLSLGVHAAFLMMFYFMPPSTQALSLDQVSATDRMVQYLDVAPEAVQDDPPPEWAERPDEPAGGTGERHADEEGQSGDEEAAPSTGRYGIAGDDPNPQMARDRVAENMDQIGAIGTLNALVGSWDSPTSPYGADQARGNDPMSAIGAIMGDHVGANFGFNGLGMNGTGRGGGGTGLGTYGLGRLGTIGHGGGRGQGQGYGDGVGLPNGGRRSRVPGRITPERANVMGGLSPEAIRRVVRRHLPEVRFCYEQGLQSNPGIEGRVTVSWIIGSSGAVQSSNVTASSLGNGRVESCISQAVRRWSFPQPEGGGVVGVNYPFMLRAN